MNDQLQSQILGLSLAIMTALGCLAYEKLVKNFSYFTVGLLVSLSYTPFWVYSALTVGAIKNDLQNLPKHWIAVLLFMLSGATGPLWYAITRKQNMMVGAIYEIKYIVLLALFYLLFGETKLTLNTLIGICLAIASVYFISK